MSDDRSSYIFNGGSVNGLYAAPSRKENGRGNTHGKGIRGGGNRPTSQDSQVKRQLRKDEDDMKDKLLDEVSQRCSKAEARVEELLLEKARVERELASTKFDREELQRSRAELEYVKNESVETSNRVDELLEHEREVTRTLTNQLLTLSKTKEMQEREFQHQFMQMREALYQAQEMNQALSQQVAHLEGKLGMVYDSYESQEQTFLDTKAKEAEYRRGYDTLSAENEELGERLNQAIDENTELKNVGDSNAEKIEALTKELETTKKKLNIVSEKNRTLEAKVTELEPANEQLEGKLHRLMSQLKNANKKSTFLGEKTESWTRKCQEQEAEIAKLASLNDELKAKLALAKERIDYEKYQNKPTQESSTTQMPILERVRQGPRSVTQTKPIASTSKSKTYELNVKPQKPQTSPHDPALASDSDAPEWLRF